MIHYVRGEFVEDPQKARTVFFRIECTHEVIERVVTVTTERYSIFEASVTCQECLEKLHASQVMEYVKERRF